MTTTRNPERDNAAAVEREVRATFAEALGESRRARGRKGGRQVTQVERCQCETCVAFLAQISQASDEACQVVLAAAEAAGWPPVAMAGLGSAEHEDGWRSMVDLATFAQLVEMLQVAHRAAA